MIPREESDVRGRRIVGFRSEQSFLHTPTLPNRDGEDPHRRRPADPLAQTPLRGDGAVTTQDHQPRHNHRPWPHEQKRQNPPEPQGRTPAPREDATATGEPPLDSDAGADHGPTQHPAPDVARSTDSSHP